MPIVLIILPADFFDKGQSLCLSVLLLDTECPACGMTRAIQHLVHFQFQEAMEFNKLSAIVLPVLFVVYFIEIKRMIKILKKNKS